jgi:hypothetical protein
MVLSRALRLGIAPGFVVHLIATLRGFLRRTNFCPPSPLRLLIPGQALSPLKMVAEVIDPVTRPLQRNYTELQLCAIEAKNISRMNPLLVM